MGIEQVVEKLRTLGVFPKIVSESAEIFRDCATTDEVARELGRRHSSCGEGQFIYFHLQAVLKKESGFKSRFLGEAVQRLGDTRIQPAHIEEYFQIGENPGLMFMLSHEDEYEGVLRLEFSRRADQYALDKMREWLGVL